jgi:peptide chain release factor 1
MLNKSIIDNCELLTKTKAELEKKITSAEVVKNSLEYKNIVKEYNRITEILKVYHAVLDLEKKIKELENEKKHSDKEYVELIIEEIEILEKQKTELENQLLKLLIPPDPNDSKNIILEIRAGTGGEEAALFAADLFRMYSKFALKHGWQLEVVDINETGLKGIKEVICYISGKDVYQFLKYESGVHRVQRVPETEASGRIHTSAVTVAVLPEVEEVDIKINPSDLEIETMGSSGHGGQHLQKTESAVRIRHIPTGIVVKCQDERSQIKNREKAMKILRSRLYDLMKQQQEETISQLRRQQVKSGDRSDKIRTYNFPQNRVTDHRINFSVYNITEVMDGEIDEIIKALEEADLKDRISKLLVESK